MQIEMGYSQILWLLPTDSSAEDYYVTEVGNSWLDRVQCCGCILRYEGTMNLFLVFRTPDGMEVVTPPLSDVILPGITRDSVWTIKSVCRELNLLPLG